MRIKSIALILTLLFLSCAQNEVKEKLIFDVNTTVIDVRTDAEFNQGHLERAINIPYTEIQERIKEYVKNPQERIVLYCRSGHRAGIAKEKLEEIGYTNVINAGGYEDIKALEKEK